MVAAVRSSETAAARIREDLIRGLDGDMNQTGFAPVCEPAASPPIHPPEICRVAIRRRGFLNLVWACPPKRSMAWIVAKKPIW